MTEAELEQIQDACPLSSQWQKPTVFVDTARIDGVDIHLAGMSTEDQDGQLVTGSAAQLSGSPLLRAYFELLERTSIADAMRDRLEEYELLDAEGRGIGNLSRDRVFFESPDPERWRYARSNGVAADTTWTAACRKAAWELAERDRILRSWYGQIPPAPVALRDDAIPAGIRAHYCFEAHRFDGEMSGPRVVAVFGFPRTREVPLVLGYGAYRCLRASPP